MIVLISPEHSLSNEMDVLHQLFKVGLTYYHLRKPNLDYQCHCYYLNQIDKKYHNRIVVHNFHELVNEFDLKGIHFQEAKRRSFFNTNTEIRTKEQFIAAYANQLKIQNSKLKTRSISSSFHEPEELEQCSFEFDYHLLSPVFSSISKKGYEGRGFDVNHIDKTIIGMGGVTTDNLEKFDSLGFSGVGVLGGVWNSKTPVLDFQRMIKHFE